MRQSVVMQTVVRIEKHVVGLISLRSQLCFKKKLKLDALILNATKDYVKKMLKFLKLKDLLLNYVIMTSKTSGRT